MQQAGKQFVAGWQSHGTPLRAAFEVLYQRFVVLAVDEAHANASGCSIDKSVHFVQALAQEHGLNLFDRMQVAYREGNAIKTAHMHDFGDMLAAGTVTSNTVVFNNLVQTVAELQTSWEVPVEKSWHARMIPA